MLVICEGIAAAAGGEIPPVRVTVDNTIQHQSMEGFGATHVSLTEGSQDQLSPTMRAKAIDAVYHQVHLTTGNVEVAVLEVPALATDLYGEQANDDNDPFHYNWSGFNFVRSDAAKQKIVDLARPLGFDNFYLALKVNVRWASTWLKPLRYHSYSRYLDECAEQVLAGAIHWRDAYGIVPRYIQLFNEPTTGNRELDSGSTTEIIDIIKRTGARLRAEGFAALSFVVPGEETEAASLRTATAILTDPEARQYVGAIAYHPYPYGSTYASIRNILETSGHGQPDPGKVALRSQLRQLGQQYHLPLWMTEVSHGGVPALSFDGLIGRAIHIHDELVYADAAAYFGMSNMASTLPVHGRAHDPLAEEGAPAIVDMPAEKVLITGMGYAIGHYARWISRGAIRIDASSSDPLLQVTAFRDDRQQRWVMVWINNAEGPVMVEAHLNGIATPERLTFQGEQSTVLAAWAALAPFDAAATFSTTVPAKSVTTIAASMAAAASKRP